MKPTTPPLPRKNEENNGGIEQKYSPHIERERQEVNIRTERTIANKRERVRADENERDFLKSFVEKSKHQKSR